MKLGELLTVILNLFRPSVKELEERKTIQLSFCLLATNVHN